MAIKGGKRKWIWGAAVLLLAAAVTATGIFVCYGWFGVNAFLRRGGSIWPEVKAADPRLSPAMQAALQPAIPEAAEGPLAWKELAPGMDVGELPVLADGREVDLILLTRIDPARFRVEVHNAPAGDRDLDDWMKQLGAVMVINGSYYGTKGQPATPFLSEGAQLGPAKYTASHGAFVATEHGATIVDLRTEPWEHAFAGAHDAFVSYPLLVAPGGTHVGEDSNWLANRSFVAQDRQGRIVFGTTADAFFSLHRLAAFLEKSSLGLTMALNLDGGPLACQAVALNGFTRDFCGTHELQAEGGQFRLLQPMLGQRRWALPIVISVTRNGG